jgi:hypothetical protein
LERVSEAGGGGTRGGESFGLWSVDSLVVLDLSAATYLPYILPTTFCIHFCFAVHIFYISICISTCDRVELSGGRVGDEGGWIVANEEKNSKFKPSLFVCSNFLTSFYST